jgi:hypothetical protein
MPHESTTWAEWGRRGRCSMIYLERTAWGLCGVVAWSAIVLCACNGSAFWTMLVVLGAPLFLLALCLPYDVASTEPSVLRPTLDTRSSRQRW